MRLPFGLRRGARSELGGFFGKLETRVLEALWRRGEASSVRDLRDQFPATAYTTLMTTLDRLHRKGVLARVKEGRAFLYRPLYTREQLRVGLAENALGSIFGAGLSGRPILSFLVEAVSRQDRKLLDDLERLVREGRNTTTTDSQRRRSR